MHTAVLGPTNAAVHDRGVLRRWRDAHRAHAAHGRGPIWESAHEDPLQRSAIRGMDAAADSHYRRGAPRSARSRRRRRASPKATATPGIANGRRPPTDCMPRPRDAPRAVRGSAALPLSAGVNILPHFLSAVVRPADRSSRQVRLCTRGRGFCPRRGVVRSADHTGESLLKVFREISKEVVAEIGSSDDFSKKIYQSYHQFHASITNWSDIAEHAVLNSRGLA